MDNKELIKEAIELAKQSGNSKEIILKLVERVEELEPKPQSIVWEPKNGEKYWSINGVGQVNSDAWFGSNYAKEELKHHNIFRTRDQAVKAAQHQRRYNMVLQAVLELEPDQVVYSGGGDQIKYTVYFSHKSGAWDWEPHCVTESGYPVLTDKKNLQPLLDYLNAKEKENG